MIAINPVDTHLTGTHVDLRPITVADAAKTLEWRLSSRASLLNKGAVTIRQQADWIASRPADEFNFIIQLKSGVSIGMISLGFIDQLNSRAEPGRFLIGEEDAARGLPAAAEAMMHIYTLAFDHLKLHRVHGMVAADNHRMIKWQKYVGMQEEGILRDHYFVNGRFQDAVCFGLLKPEYRAVACPRLKSLIAMARATR